MPVTLPFQLVAGELIRYSRLMANFNALAAKFTGGIVDADTSDLMALNGSKIAVNTLPADRIIAGSITVTQMGSNSVGTAQLVAGSVTGGAGGKIATNTITKANVITTAASNLALSNLDVVQDTCTYTAVAAGATVLATGSTRPVATYQLLSIFPVTTGLAAGFMVEPSSAGANWTFTVRGAVTGEASGSGGGTFIAIFIRKV